MYFRNYRLQKSFLEKSLKSTGSEQSLAVNTCESVPTGYEISKRALLSCSFIILREADLEYFSLVLGEILEMFVNTLTADGKYPLQGWENLQLLFQMQLSQKEKMFSSLSGIYIKF